MIKHVLNVFSENTNMNKWQLLLTKETIIVFVYRIILNSLTQGVLRYVLFDYQLLYIFIVSPKIPFGKI